MTDANSPPGGASARPFRPDAELAAIVDSAADAIVSKNLDGIITSWNQGAERMFGYAAGEVLGHSATRLLPPERRDEEQQILEQIRRGERLDHFETVRVRKNGERFPVSVSITPIRDTNGAVIGASKIARDMSTDVRAAEVDALLSAIVDSSHDAIVSKTLEGIVTSWNRGAEQLFGYTASEMVGQSVCRLFPADRADEEPGILERIRRGERVEPFETKRVRKDGTIIDVSVTISPVRDRSGAIIGASKIARDITEERNARERLMQANGELRRADQLKSEFLATLSHELRTPLNAILGWTQVLKESGFNDPEELAEAIEVIERNARAQASMIEELLDVSRITSGKVILDIQQLDLPAVVQAAMQSLEPTARARSIRLTSAFSSLGHVVMGDRNRMQQVVWNLLSNAIKFTPKGGRVHVTVDRVRSQVRIAVSDNGQGIAPEFLPFLFERFRQADGSTRRRHGGLGLGLSIVKQLVELHGGEVSASSEGEGRGSTFTVYLPVMSTRHAFLDGASAESDREGSRGDDSRAVLRGVRVLAVDDEPDSLSLVKRILELRGAEVRTATSVAEARIALAESPPDVLLSDIGMPDEDGYDLIRHVRSLPVGRALPAVALTALARAEDRTQCLRMGFQTHVAKPVEPAELVAVVSGLVFLSGRRR